MSMGLMFAFANPVNAQNKTQNFYNGEYYIQLKGDSVQLLIQSNYNPEMMIAGTGTYELIGEKYMYVTLGEYDGENSVIKKSKRKKRGSNVHIKDKQGRALNDLNVIIKDDNKRIVWGAISDEDGKTSVPEKYDGSILQISYTGVDNLEFLFDSEYQYKIYLTNYDVVENRCMLFEIEKWTDDVLICNFLSFRDNGANKGLEVLDDIASHLMSNNSISGVFKLK